MIVVSKKSLARDKDRLPLWTLARIVACESSDWSAGGKKAGGKNASVLCPVGDIGS